MSNETAPLSAVRVEPVVSWWKACNCGGTASTEQFRSELTEKGLGSMKFKVWYYTQPSCDVCGKPWDLAN